MGFDQLRAKLQRQPAGLHQLGPPQAVLDAELPAALAELYRSFNGAELFFGALLVLPAARARRQESAWLIGEVDGDDLWVTDRGAVEIVEKDTGERLPEGSTLLRWLRGWIEAQGLLYDDDGEYREEAFSESGDVALEVAIRMARRLLERDPGACAPRWRLARALVDRGSIGEARDQLEQVVAREPGFAWAWYDLARISERLGDPAAGVDELEAAVDARPDYEHAGFFLAHGARLAGLAGDSSRSAELAARAISIDPGLVRAQRDAARVQLEAGAVEEARELIALALALAPRDLEALQLRAAIETASERY